MMVIGLSGKIGCGKTTLARKIMDEALYEVCARVAFGDLLKRECAVYFGFPLEWCDSQPGKRRVITGHDGLTVREALQWYGTDFRRAQDEDYWVKAMDRKLVELKERYDDGRSLLVVIDDVRFLNEAQFCLGKGLLFRLEPYPGWRPGPHAGHVSETALDHFDGFTGTFRPLYGELALVANEVLESMEEKERDA